MALMGYLRGIWADVVKYRMRLAIGLAFTGLLTIACIRLQEQFPFSHFPLKIKQKYHSH